MMKSIGIFKHYSRHTLWLLFSSTAFLLHVWTFILFFRDFSWLAERSTSWDAVGVGAYGLIFTLVETIAVFLFLVLLGFFVSVNWGTDVRKGVLFVLLFMTTLWAVLGQVYFLASFSLPAPLIRFLASRVHPLWWVYGIIGSVVFATMVIPVFITITKKEIAKSFHLIMERLAILTIFYLLIDVIGLVILIVRNA